jgi:transglutaminase-like putative cysteine protease
MTSDGRKNLSLFILSIAFVFFVYGTFKALEISDRKQVGTSNGIYTSYVTTSEEIQAKALDLAKYCTNELCKVQSVLDFVTNIPYHTTTFQRYSAQKTIQQNFGDCDDKSNLLISMLHSLDKEAYFVLVPKHIFIITSIEDRRLNKVKGLWVNGKKYFILESTAKGSRVGFPLQYRLDEIDVIVEPFSNEKISIEKLEWKR